MTDRTVRICALIILGTLLFVDLLLHTWLDMLLMAVIFGIAYAVGRALSRGTRV